MAEFSRERLAGYESRIAAHHPEWVVTEGYVSGGLMPEVITLPSCVAEALYDANRRLFDMSLVLNGTLGSFGEPLAIYLMAGKRSIEDNAVIVPSIRIIDWLRGNRQRTRFDLRSQISPVDSEAACLSDIAGHTDGLSVDVAAVYAKTGRLLEPRQCYGAFYFGARVPNTFPGIAKLSDVQKQAASALLHTAMSAAGFTCPKGKEPWHYEFTKGD